jgi:hypothetical protein
MTHEVDEIIAMAAVGRRWVLRYRLATGEAAGQYGHAADCRHVTTIDMERCLN